MLINSSCYSYSYCLCTRTGTFSSVRNSVNFVCIEVNCVCSTVKYVIGIPTVPRASVSYLFSTIDSLISGMDEKRAGESLILVSIAPPPGALLVDPDRPDAEATGADGGALALNASEYTALADALLDELETRFQAHVRSGLLELLVVPLDYYPSLLPYPHEMNAQLERSERDSQSFIERQEKLETQHQQEERELVPPLELNREFSHEFRYLNAAANASAARAGQFRRGHAHRGPGNIWTRGDPLQRTVWRCLTLDLMNMTRIVCLSLFFP